MVFDKFKSWRKQDTEPTVDCPLCGTKNPESAKECSQCLYQLGKASFEQVAPVDDAEANSLFDELLADIDDAEEAEEVIDWSKGTFTMDDVTIDVEQYGSDEGIELSENPSFSMTVSHPENLDEEDEEDYVLSAADAPEFVTKFEVPESELEPLEEIPKQKLTLVEPTSVGSEEVEIVAADEVPDTNGNLPEPMPTESEPELEEQQESDEEPDIEPEVEVKQEEATKAALLSLKKDQLISLAKDAGLSTLGTKAELADRIITGEDADTEVVDTKPELEVEMPPPPPVVPATSLGMPPPPPVAARPVDPLDQVFDRPSPPVIPKIPKSPTLPHIEEANTSLDIPESNGFWPWPQQEEWPNSEVVNKVREAMSEAKSKNIAQVTVILDEVGPHLGNRTKLLYPIGALLQRIGRVSAVDNMIATAIDSHPEDPDVLQAKAKLRP